MGIMATKFIANVVFEKNQYTCGELARFRVELDNTQCDKPVQSVKIKICRKYMIKSKVGTTLYRVYNSYKHVTYDRYNISTMKYPNPCKEHEKVSIECEVPIPLNDMGGGNIHPHVCATPD